jgi:hypothetical protein
MAGLLTAVGASVSVLAALAHGIVFVIVAVAVGAASFLGFYLALPSGAARISKKNYPDVGKLTEISLSLR